MRTSPVKDTLQRAAGAADWHLALQARRRRVELTSLERGFAESDVVTLHLAASAETFRLGVINPQVLARESPRV